MASSTSQSNQTVSEWDRRIFSQSTNTLLDRVAQQDEGENLFKLMQILRGLHKEYGTKADVGSDPFGNLLKYMEVSGPDFFSPKRTSPAWAKLVRNVIRIPKNFPDINGRMFLLAVLLSEFQTVSDLLNQDLNWKAGCLRLVGALEKELYLEKDIDTNELLTTKGRQLRAIIDREGQSKSTKNWDEYDSLIRTQNLSDTPTKKDALSRKTLADYLAKRLRFIYNRDIQHNSAFFMHIDGAWGSGKSTLLGFLKDALEQTASEPVLPGQKSEGPWVVINFNAWENQRLDPPWWFLLQTVYRDAVRALWKLDKTKFFNVWLTEIWWKLRSRGKNIGTALIAFAIFLVARYNDATTADLFNKLPVVQIITFLVFIWSIAKSVSGSFLSGSAKAAQSFLEVNSSDPMNRLTAHFQNLIKKIDYPSIVFIDDLDRCNKDYGIKLLEGLQTIYKNAPVVYVIAADRKWISTMYEDQYSLFASTITRPAKPFGHVFLDKIFQWIIELPEISVEQKKLYWDSLLNISRPSQHEDQVLIREKINQASGLKTKLTVIDELADKNAQQFAREQVVASLSIQDEEQVFEHKLQEFLSVIEPNPRSMKRLINDISTARAMTILYNQNISEDQLILWTILKQQYPGLSKSLWDQPETIDTILAKNIPDKNFEELLKKNEVRQLFDYQIQGRNIRLDLNFLNKMKFQDVSSIA